LLSGGHAGIVSAMSASTPPDSALTNLITESCRKQFALGYSTGYCEMQIRVARLVAEMVLDSTVSTYWYERLMDLCKFEVRVPDRVD